MKEIDFYLVLNRINIQNANSVSSPLTYGFPAMSGFLGMVHALQRKMPFEVGLSFEGALIACHNINVRRYRQNSYSDYTFNQSRNPIKKDGKTASIIEEGKLDLTVSLVIPVACEDLDDVDWLNDSQNQSGFIAWARNTVSQNRVAGGSVFDITDVSVIPQEALETCKSLLSPAFVLMDASSELADIVDEMQQNVPEATALDALIEVSTLNHQPVIDSKGKLEWQTKSVKQGRGWLVPMPVGFQAISRLYDAGMMQECRTSEYPSQFVEALYGLGKWVFPYSISNLEQAFWQMTDNDEGLYLIQQDKD